jgi:hypothetical protein
MAGLGAQDLDGFEGFLGLYDGADWGRFGDAGDEQVPFIVTAEVLALLPAPSPDQEQQVAVGGLHVKNGDLNLSPRLTNDLEKLALTVGLHVQGDDVCPAAAPRRTISDLQACANAGKLDVKQIRVHEGEDIKQVEEVRSIPMRKNIDTGDTEV